SPVAGLRTPKVPSVGAVSPAMVMTNSDMALLGGGRTRRIPYRRCDLARPSSHLARCCSIGRGAFVNPLAGSVEELPDEGVHGGPDPRRQGTVMGRGGDDGARLVEEAQHQGRSDARIPRYRHSLFLGPREGALQQRDAGG